MEIYLLLKCWLGSYRSIKCFGVERLGVGQICQLASSQGRCSQLGKSLGLACGWRPVRLWMLTNTLPFGRAAATKIYRPLLQGGCLKPDVEHHCPALIYRLQLAVKSLSKYFHAAGINQSAKAGASGRANLLLHSRCQ